MRQIKNGIRGFDVAAVAGIYASLAAGMLISPSNSSTGCLAKQNVNELNLQQHPDEAGRRDRRLQRRLAKEPQFAAIPKSTGPPGDRAIPGL